MKNTSLKSLSQSIQLLKNFLDINLKNFTRYSALKNFKKFIKIDEFTFCHTINNKYIYEDTKINFKKKLCFGT